LKPYNPKDLNWPWSPFDGEPVQKRNRVAIASLAIVAIALAGWFSLTRHMSVEPIVTDPGSILSVDCIAEGGWPANGPWRLSLDAQGNGSFARWHRSPIHVSLPKVMPELTKAIRKYRLSELPPPSEYGMVDHGTIALRIKTTTLDKTITVDRYPFGDEEHRRALQIWDVIERGASDVLETTVSRLAQ
jgi:hypothetical protein